VTLNNLKYALILNDKKLVQYLKQFLHSHDNLPTLNGLSVNDTGDLTFNGNIINEQDILTDEQIQQMVDQVIAELNGEDLDIVTGTPFIITRDNRDEILRFKDENGILNIPATFTGTNGVKYKIVGIEYGYEDINGNMISLINDLNNINEIILPNIISFIAAYAFSFSKNLINVTLPNNILNLSPYIFMGCSNLLSVTLPQNITNTGIGTFCSCSSLTNVTIPDNVTIIGKETFSGCTSLASINIPKNVVYIGPNAFRRCGSLTKITIPNSCTKIYPYAFGDCTSLTDLIIPDSVIEIGKDAFKNVSHIVYHGSATSDNNWGALSIN